jgi:uncharacterized protein YifE (UPF0438 family)
MEESEQKIEVGIKNLMRDLWEGIKYNNDTQKVFKPLNLEKLKPGTEEYKRAEQYLENKCNYVSCSEKGYAKYRAQLIEQEDFRNEKMFNKLKYRMTSIW